MKIARSICTAAAFVGLSLLAACVSAPAPAPPPPAPKPAPAPPPAPIARDWRDWPVAAGDWSYRALPDGTIASFGVAGQPALLSFRCESATKRLFVARATSFAPDRLSGQMTVHTSFGAVQWPVVPGAEPGASGAYAIATRAANDSALDQISFSRGRFAIEATGAAPLAVPNWAEVSRVIEDCRG